MSPRTAASSPAVKHEMFYRDAEDAEISRVDIWKLSDILFSISLYVHLKETFGVVVQSVDPS